MQYRTTKASTSMTMPNIFNTLHNTGKSTKIAHWFAFRNLVQAWAIAFAAVILINSINMCMGKKLNASQAFDNTWSTATDLENELECVSSQQKRSPKNTPYSNVGGNIGPWSPWSEWSTCSRTCDGGVMQQIRRCQNINGCKGESVRYRICNMQPCPEQQDFRARQCSAYNDVPYDGTLYKWSPHYDYVEPCALTCRGRPAHLNDDSSPESTAEDGEHYDELNVVVQLSPRVQDGTRCRSGSLDMCIQGKCLRVGCDLKIGSTKRVDGCGLCGGDGSSCSQALHQWEIASISLCSVSCGGGYKMSHVVCRNRVSGVEVEDALCNVANRPEPTVELCNTHTCPPRWIADEWGPCSRLCGPGVRERMVVCAEENNGIKTRVADIMCSLPKPALQDQCILEECPKWEIEEWTECSVSCGQGIQMRGVECKSPDGRLSAKCDPVTKPSSVQQCANIITCDGSASSDGGGTIIVGNSNPRDVISNGKMHPDMEEHTDEDDGEEDEDDSADVEDDNISTDDGLDGSTYNDQPLAYSHNTLNQLHQEETDGPKTMRLTANNGGYGARHQEYENENEPSEPTYIKDNEWSQCSVTCGEGIRRRAYRCKIFLEYSRTLAIVNDSLCEGSRPHDEVERCVEEPCMLPSHGYEEHYPRDAIKVGVSEPGKTYVWREQGYTSCSASCLGGVEELIINCVREDNGRVVSPFLCAPETKPESRVRTCNDRPCPPRWNYSDYTPCSKSCGIGIKTREVQCIHEVTRGGDNTMMVPNSMCPQPPPADRQYCNVLDCPVRWEVGEWSKCSHTCGYGIKERKVECKQIMAQEHKIERPESMCPSVRPSDKKPCNVKPCPPEDPKPVIQISNTTHIQHDPKKSKITLKVGGAGVVFFGTQVKIKCPVKRYNRTKIKWSKDHKPLIKTRKFKVSKKGALRILDITFRDVGVYSCHAGLSSAEIQIDVKAKPGQQSEDPDSRRDSDRLVRERSGLEALTAADMTASDNRTQTSHRKHQQQQQQQQLNGRERSGRKIDGVQHADSSRMEDEHSQLMQRAQDGLPQSATVSSGGTGRHTNALLAMPYFQTLLANLQYLWPSLQKFSNSRGHSILANRDWLYGMDFEQEDEPHQSSQTTSQVSNKDTRLGSSLTATVSAMSSLPKPPLVDDINSALHINTNSNRDVDVDVDADIDVDVDVDVDVDMHVNETSGFKDTIASSLHLPHARWPNHWTNAQVLNTNYDVSEKGTTTTTTIAASFITYKWQMSPWSECSQKCDAFGTGLRRRTATCIRVHFVNDKSDAVSMPSEASTTLEQEVVENVFCETYGLNTLTTSETCSTAGNGCAHWYKGEWTLCHRSRCYGPNTAVQKRKVSCRYANDTLATTCSEYEKPLNRQECYNERCKGVWRVESWSECNAPCGRQGIKYRILQCVWYGTRRPAGNSCKHQPRPAVMKVCKSPPCFAKALQQQHCADTSRYCRNVRTMGLCRLYRYQEKCCKSCQLHYYHNIPN